MTLNRPLQNRVTPFQEIVSDPARGMFMGNRGGKIHDPASKTLHQTRRWTSRRWICCVTDFKNRQRQVMGNGYTELFFLDEPTALAAGHRPCFECRRKDAKAFAAAFAAGLDLGEVPNADEMDRILHVDRLEGRHQRRYIAPVESLPDGVMVAAAGTAFLVQNRQLFAWHPSGYLTAPLSGTSETVEVLTPRAIVAALAAGYRPALDPKLRSTIHHDL